MPRKAKRSEKRTALLEAAALVFARRGYSAASMAEIAQEAGVGKGTLYEYFASKQDLFFSVFEWLSSRIGQAARVETAALGGPPSKRLAAAMEAVLAAHREFLPFYPVVMEFWSLLRPEELRQRTEKLFQGFYGEFSRLVGGLIGEGVAQGEFRPDLEPASLVLALGGAVDGLFTWAWLDDKFDPLPVGRHFTACLIRGMLRPPGGKYEA